MRDIARSHNLSMMAAASAVCEEKSLAARALGALTAFIELMKQLRADTENSTLDDLMEHTIHASTLYEHYNKDKSERGQARIENLEELINATRYFEHEQEDEMDELSAFLSHAALEAGETQGDNWQDCVQLMTLHSAKGLEFPLVFLCGIEEGLFPHERSLSEPGRLEEERRLCYVGITRARQRLHISYAESRRLYGSESYPHPSRFISELPDELLHEVRLRGNSSQPGYYKSPSYDDSDSEFYLGQRVTHDKFGDGVVLNYEGQGSNARIQVNFDDVGSKWLVVAFANLHVA